jgi:hypothetical protein
LYLLKEEEPIVPQDVKGTYQVLASLECYAAACSFTTLNAGDIAFSAYTSTTSGDDFSLFY